MNTDIQNVLLVTLRDIADYAAHPKAVEGPALARIERLARAALAVAASPLAGLSPLPKMEPLPPLRPLYEPGSIEESKFKLAVIEAQAKAKNITPHPATRRIMVDDDVMHEEEI